MITLQQLRDDKNEAAAIFGFTANTSQRILANSASANSTTGFAAGYKMFTICSDQPVIFDYRSNSAPGITNSHLLPANWLLDVKTDPTGNAYFSFQALTVTANVFVSPRV